MISIKQLLERSQSSPGSDGLPEMVTRLRELLTNAIPARRPLKRELGTLDFPGISRSLLSRLDKVSLPLELASLAADALEATEEYVWRISECFDGHIRELQTMVTMFTDTVAGLTGESDASIARLQAIERQIERASALDDIQSLKANLAGCLAAVKEAAAQQKKATASTVERLGNYIKNSPQPSATGAPTAPVTTSAAGALTPADYVAAFKLQHADHILKRFGEGARDQMLSLIGAGLKPAQGPNDRLMRWKGPSFVMFLSSSESLPGIRRRLSAAVAKISQHYVELGKNAALLAVGVDWLVFAQSQYSSLDVVFEEVDVFLTKAVGNS